VCRINLGETKQSGGGGQEGVDLSSKVAMVTAKWKQGGTFESDREKMPANEGQVRKFRIVSLDTQAKKIQIEFGLTGSLPSPRPF
jgi:hypothetical protein